MKVLSLFNGISCGMLALERAGIFVSEYVSYEIDKYANQITAKNYPKIKQHGDVIGADFTKYKGFDIVMGGFPCQDLSIAKREREGLEGKRSRLFWELVRAIHEVQPKYFLVENNYGMPKDAQRVITETLGVAPIMINSALVSAQTRKRLYWTNIPNVTQPTDKNIILKDILESEIGAADKAYCITASYKTGVSLPHVLVRHARTFITQPIRIGQIGNGGMAQRIYSVSGKSVALKGNGGGQGANTGLYKINLPDGDYVIRKLTPIECERLQTLPDNFTEGISNTQRYKTIGNGWTADVIAHILSHIPH